ncbi:hypothetical protein SERLA73DRAFT_173630 [Serpula lacrymans var. lacrymans S7.3]|uniref:Thioredoxin domain-containing protein n=2 Tax=Serpula lacrymans var. lacrymans TaxID=341189 RepID=F8PF85_SERL3|nr:uncharacterized protein SERLADRAFT_454425 [Serpula lacrymans var. lacrymans S7.9]EGO04191.1 hypothetical protein SERLA73DRAFT_173630 [Serpula lacrymans var. lacrymans S7.3]EGO30134.1 hypothetical protein SERLADRAFT_454425 [Serpula lacrymans var. lacrymans S7.9]
MRPFKAILQLPLSLLVASLTVRAAAVPVKSTHLTPEDFKQTISEGVWFVEHFSPYCGHCQKFEPTWMNLVEEFEKSSDPGIHLAQVNCAVNGDLCSENGITGYPQMNLYRNGEFVEMYRKDRDFDMLVEYISTHAEPTATPSVPSTTAAVEIPTSTRPAEPLHVQTARAALNPSGAVVSLGPDNFQDFIDQGPTFIKFFAPWCGHCKKLAPVWTQLARHMQNKLNVAEVNCDDHKSLCTSQGVTGFPMLFYYAHGAKTEYTGGRKYEQLIAFTDKAAAPTMEEITADALEGYVQKHPVLYLLLHSSPDTAIVHEVGKDSHLLLGSPPIYTSTSQELFNRYSVPTTSSWALLALKDHDSKIPTSMYYPSSTKAQGSLTTWLLENRLPTSVELSRDAFQQVMNAPHKPLVVIAGSYKDSEENIPEKIVDIGKKWKLSKGHEGQREVVFTWMDGGQWGSWMKNMYGMKANSGPAVVIADHQSLLYYDQDPSGQPIKLTSTSIFSAIDGINQGSVNAKHSENMIERFIRGLNDGANWGAAWIAEHPYMTVFIIAASLVTLVIVVKRALSEDLSTLRGDSRKSNRLD